ncbi:MAG: pentapeptide repeat-containing protein [Anaerolineales bacterium]|nr:pentapeptide repeat-containing protein [Anaerolineales bacterium]
MATLQSTKFIGTNLRRANLCRTDLSQALLVVVTLRWADFTEANLSRATINEAIFYDTILTEADLQKLF